MPIEDRPILRFNAGLLSPLALAREDLKRYGFSAETQTNFMPRSLGSMMLRPGTAYTGATYLNKKAVHLPFIYANDDTALIELTDSIMRVKVNEVAISRVAVSTAITNGTFTSNVTGWTDDDELGGTSDWLAGGYMTLVGNGSSRAIRHQLVACAVGDRNKEHAVRIVVTQGTCTFRVGLTAGGQDFIEEQMLDVGTHSLAFTPTNDFYVWVSANKKYTTKIDSIIIESSGDMLLPTPWDEATIPLVRFDQSADVLFCDCYGVRPKKIERRGVRSWSIVNYQPEDGAFRTQNLTKTQLTLSGLSGDVTILASQSVFKPSHVGALFRITAVGQNVSSSISSDNVYTDPIIVSGVGSSQRSFTIERSGVWVATVTLQKSFDEGATWYDVTTYSTNATVTYSDGLDNQVIWYRIGVKVGDYTSGTITTSLRYPNGSIPGIALITGYSDSKFVSAIMLKDSGSAASTSDWEEGIWSDYRGWPSTCAFHEGRLWHTGSDRVIGSVTDAFDSFDDSIEGDSAPMNRSIGSGAVDRIAWILSLQRLGIGGESGEHFCQSSSLDEPLTVTNFNIRTPSTQGSAQVAAVKIDNTAVFVQASGQRLFQVGYDSTVVQYQSEELTAFCPEVCGAGIVKLAVQRQPDTRIHALLEDGTVAVFIYSKFQDINCWVKVEMSGTVEDIVILPGTEEDKVYYCVKHGSNRYLERWALESECIGGLLNKNIDSHIVYDSTPTTTITGLDHLEGLSVVVWADGKDVGSHTVASGSITLSVAASKVVVGLGYDAYFKSAKLAWGAALGSAMTQKKKVGHVGFLLRNTHARGLQYGRDFTDMDDLPGVEAGAVVDHDSVWTDYDYENVEFPGGWETDPRVCLHAFAPRPCTVLGIIVTLQTSDKV